MIKSHRTFFIGLFLLILPFLGFPSSWKSFFIFIISILLIVFSIQIKISKKMFIKPKSKLKPREKTTPVFTENSPIERAEPPTVDQNND